jgi:imidazolonepropionase-like amidohydrolase
MTMRAAAGGVRVLAGTDAGLVDHGLIREEVQSLITAGLRPDLALAAASWDARAFLGLPGIEESAPADLVAYTDDPRAGAEVLYHPVLRVLDGIFQPLGG